MAEEGSSQSERSDWLERARFSRAARNEVIVNRGVLLEIPRAVEYYTTQPSPTQWIAVGVVPVAAGAEDPGATHRLLVGTGASEGAAIDALRRRVLRLGPDLSMHYLSAPPSAQQPSDWFGD